MRKADRFGRAASLEAQQRNLAKKLGPAYGKQAREQLAAFTARIGPDGWEYANLGDLMIGRKKWPSEHNWNKEHGSLLSHNFNDAVFIMPGFRATRIFVNDIRIS